MCVILICKGKKNAKRRKICDKIKILKESSFLELETVQSVYYTSIVEEGGGARTRELFIKY